ncbi:MAG: polyphenol oxidase family protein [Thermoanaerobaculia bacterium]|nr:polyphenol oxidase family protein [Thermoanaerobaculia bacterium]
MELLPEYRAGSWCWSDHRGDVSVRFVGKGGAFDLETAVRAQLPAGVEPAWLRQVHSDRVVDASPGCCGEGDALWARDSGLGLAVVTADCVPVILAGREGVAVAHAGWRGVAAEIVAATLARLGEPVQQVTAWIGPAIGRCCYEVGHDVAARVVEAIAPGRRAGVLLAGPRDRPHLDLAAAVAAQLETQGIGEIQRVACCTRCSETMLWSYRRDGQQAGRNLALVWRGAKNRKGSAG